MYQTIHPDDCECNYCTVGGCAWCGCPDDCMCHEGCEEKCSLECPAPIGTYWSEMLGRQAQHEGKKAIPAHDKSMMYWLQRDLQPDEHEKSVKLLTAWHEGYNKSVNCKHENYIEYFDCFECEDCGLEYGMKEHNQSCADNGITE